MDQSLEPSTFARLLAAPALPAARCASTRRAGLLQPLRTYSGRRLYGRGELERIQQILALKRAGLSLAQIGKLTQQGLGSCFACRGTAEDSRGSARPSSTRRSRYFFVKSRIDRGEPVDAATFCSLIRQGDKIMAPEDWKKVTDRYFSEEEQEHWAQHPPQRGVRPGRIWPQMEGSWRSRRGGDAVRARQPGGAGLYDEWQELLAPFKAVATPGMMEGATRLYDHMDEWEQDVSTPFTSEVFRFMRRSRPPKEQARCLARSRLRHRRAQFAPMLIAARSSGARRCR